MTLPFAISAKQANILLHDFFASKAWVVKAPTEYGAVTFWADKDEHMEILELRGFHIASKQASRVKGSCGRRYGLANHFSTRRSSRRENGTPRGKRMARVQ